MKKVILVLILALLLIGSLAFVYAQGNETVSFPNCGGGAGECNIAEGENYESCPKDCLSSAENKIVKDIDDYDLHSYVFDRAFGMTNLETSVTAWFNEKFSERFFRVDFYDFKTEQDAQNYVSDYNEMVNQIDEQGGNIIIGEITVSGNKIDQIINHDTNHYLWRWVSKDKLIEIGQNDIDFPEIYDINEVPSKLIEAYLEKYPSEQECFDSDGGRKYFIKGFVRKGNARFDDTCFDERGLKLGNYSVVEGYCNDKGNIETEDYVCPNGCKDGACIEEQTEEAEKITLTKEKVKGNKISTFLPYQKRNESECLDGCKCVGAVVSCPTETGKIMTIEAGRSGNVITITVNKTEVNTTLELETETNRTTNKTKLKAKLSNGRKAEVKVMPDTASEKAVERLGKLNFTIELKEVGSGNETRLVYEVQAERHYKLLALFRVKARKKAQIDAETGEVIAVKNPWWAFLAKEEE